MNIYVIGQRGEGKSTLALYLAKRIKERMHAHNVIIFDPKRTYNAISHTSDIEVFREMLEESGHGTVAFQPRRQKPGERDESGETIEEQFTEFCETIGLEKHLGEENPSRPNLGPIVLIVDEAWFLQQGSTAHPWVETLVRLGDMEQFFLIQCAHRPTDFAARVRAQANELFIFCQWSPGDLKVIEEWCGEDIAERVAALPPHHVIRFEVKGSRNTEYWNEPANWYSNISDAVTGESEAIHGEPVSSGSGNESSSSVLGNDAGSAGIGGRTAVCS